MSMTAATIDLAALELIASRAIPGEQWEDYGGRGLFDEIWAGEEVPHA